MMAEKTLMIVKPDAVAKNVTGQIIARVEAHGFTVRQLRMISLNRETAESFYDIHKERPFFGELVDFMTSGPAVPMVLEREDAVPCLREFIGPTNSEEALAGTIRGDFGTDVQCNAVHASDSIENAVREIDFFFAD
ncbi:MAG: nucleoside-diphosphate kinase [Candidatus Latescibacterota bacterium]|nr:nucleoside-diphosphate kinase [Candidatus Latescibacterota bacterium]